MSLPNRIRSVSLLELLTAIALITIVILGIASIEIFSRHHVLSSDRRAKLQNEASLALEHMTKHISDAIGNTASSEPPFVLYADNKGIRVRTDSNRDGRVDVNDVWIAYRHEDIGSPVTDSAIRYYPTAGTGVSPSGTPQPIARKVVIGSTGFELTTEGRTIEVKITCRWHPNQAVSVDNPEVTMRSKIDMPSVSAN